MLVKVTDAEIDVMEALRYVRHPSCGAVATFEGDIRDQNEGEAVVSLEYEVYEALLRTQMEKIFDEIKQKWAVHEMAVIQRMGMLKVGDVGIVLCVSSPHRREALDAVSFAIEEFKKKAPVWKKEQTTETSKWINWKPQTE